MKKLLLLTIIPFAFILANGVTLTQSSANLISLSVSLPPLQIESKEIDGKTFSDLIFPGAAIPTEIGAPQLPLIREFVEIPFGAEVTVNVENLKSEYVNLSSKVIPLQAPIPKTGPKPDFMMNEEIYSQNQFLTFVRDETKSVVRARIEMIAEIRGHRICVVEIYPVAYNPKQNVVEYVSEMKVEIILSGANLLKTQEMRDRYYSKPYDMMLSNLVKNYDAYALYPPPNLPIGYLIIVPDEWLSYVQPLAQWRTRKGYKVFVRTLTQVGGGTNNTVRNYILQAYNTWPIPPTYVLLVGDVDKIGHFTGVSAPTDLNYSLMTTPDYFPDLDVSRASVANGAQLDSLVKKIIKYEKNEWLYGNDWTKKAYFIASNDASYYHIAEGTHRYCMRLMRRYNVICDSLFLRSNLGTPVNTALNEGRAWVTYSGHGSISSWADNNFTSTSVRALTNVDKVPFVGTYACNSGEFNSSSTQECFSETWIRVGFRGAIGHYASSVTSYWYQDDTLQKRIFDASLDSNFYWAMGMINKGKLKFYQQWGDPTMVRRYFEMYNLMGDGAIDIYWDIPATLNVTYPSVIPLGTYTIPVSVMKSGVPVQNALVCAKIKNDTLFSAGYTNAMGQVSLPIMTAIPDSVYITVTAHNCAPHLGGAMALATGGPYIMYLRHLILDPAPGGNNDGIINPGEAIEMRVWFKNFGSGIANNVRAWLRTTDPNIFITDSFKNLGNIPANDSAYTSDGFNFTVATSCTNNYSLRFTLTIKDAQDSTWQSNLSLTVAQCVLRHVSTAVNDPAPGGNNNGILNRGETANLIATIRNIGGATANNVTSVLSTSTAGITILDGNGNFGSINVNNTGNNSADPYTVQVDSSVVSGTIAQFKIIVSSTNYIDTLYFSLPVDIYLLDFEANNGGFIPTPTTGGWEWGSPTSGPNSAYSGTKCWGTVLAGNYAASCNYRLDSPELTATINNPSLSFRHWYYTETNYDGGNLKIATSPNGPWTIVTPTGGYNGTASSSNVGIPSEQCYMGQSGGWLQANFTLPVTAGQRFYLRWHFGSDGSIQYAGWYIDDITGIGFAQMPLPNNDVGVDAILSPGTYHFPNTPMTPVIRVKNYGAQTQTNFPAVCSIVGTGGLLRYWDTLRVSSVASLDTVRVSFRSWTPTQTEICTVKVRTNLAGDQLPNNDRKVQTTNINPTSQIVVPSNPATTSDRLEPLDRFYNYNTHEAIYLQSEIGVAGTINQIGYYKASGSDLNAITPVTIYMKQTTDATLATGTYSLTGYTQVYNGAFPNNATEGWMEVPLSTPFPYDNTSNLAILIIKGYQAYITSSLCPLWRYTATSSYRARGARSDNSQPTSLTQTYNRPNIRFLLTSAGIEEPTNRSVTPIITMLYAPKPNPVINGIAHISYSLTEPCKIALKIYDASGRVVKTLINEFMNSGIYNLVWDGRDDNHRIVAEGIYFYTLETPKQNFTKKMIFTR